MYYMVSRVRMDDIWCCMAKYIQVRRVGNFGVYRQAEWFRKVGEVQRIIRQDGDLTFRIVQAVSKSNGAYVFVLRENVAKYSLSTAILCLLFRSLFPIIPSESANRKNQHCTSRHRASAISGFGTPKYCFSNNKDKPSKFTGVYLKTKLQMRASKQVGQIISSLFFTVPRADS